MLLKYFSTLISLSVNMGFYMMLGLILVGVMNMFLKKEFIADHLGKNNLWSIIKASLFGVPLPLCSCGVVPTGIYLKEKGAADSTVVSFLISTPQTGVDSIIATYGLMGMTFAWYRPLAAFISGIAGGLFVKVFGKKNIKRTIVSEPVSCEDGCCDTSVENNSATSEMLLIGRIRKSASYAFGTFLSDISIHFVIGLLIAVLISVLIPDTLLVELGINSGIWGMLVMIVIGLPMYICSTSSIPIALSLLAKGISPGVAFVFLFMGPFTNIASLSVISKKLGRRTTFLYLTGAILTAVAFGLLFDALAPILPFPVFGEVQNYTVRGFWNIFKTVVAGGFYIILFFNIYKKIITKIRTHKTKDNIDACCHN